MQKLMVTFHSDRGELFVLVLRPQQMQLAIKTIMDWVRDPQLDFNYEDAAYMTQQVRRICMGLLAT